MPELPEVETMRRGILAVCGSRVSEVVRPRCKLKPILIAPSFAAVRRRSVGRVIQAVERIGKRVALRFDGGDRLVFEPRMTGLVLAADPPNREHLRFALELAGGAVPRVMYWDRRGLGSIRWVDAAEFDRLYGPGRLGPDALSLGVDGLRQQLAESRSAIKVVLLDQRRIAGIGNLYASEILHVCGIHPARRASSLTRAEWQRLHAAMIDVLEEAIRYEGSTLSDGTYRNALNQAGSYQNMHRVYDRAGRLCSACQAAEIVRIVQAQRSTFFCPACQTKRRRSRST